MNLLDVDVCSHILTFLSEEQIASVGAVSHFWAELTRKPELWRFLCERDYPQFSAPHGVLEWRLHYRKCRCVATLKEACWRYLKQDRNKCPARESYAMCNWSKDSSLVFGGFGRAIYNDLYKLSLSEVGTCTWNIVAAAGAPPVARYGHTLVRCSRDHQLALVFGGMTEGGYFGERNDVHILASAQVASRTPGLCSQYSQCFEDAQQWEYCWYRPPVSGLTVAERAYHSCAVSEDGLKVYVFGGISRRRSQNDCIVLDLQTWEWHMPETRGEAPSPRFGHSSVVYKGKLWVFGGGWGHDLLRSGGDHDDVFYLDLATMEWSRLEAANECLDTECIGRCHSSTLVGSKMVFFGGSLQMTNNLIWLDLDSLEWCRPVIFGEKPMGRIAAGLVKLGDQLCLFGGWVPGCHELGDLHALELAPFTCDMNALDTADELDGIEDFQECCLQTCPCRKLVRRAPKRKSTLWSSDASHGQRANILWRSAPAAADPTSSSSGTLLPSSATTHMPIGQVCAPLCGSLWSNKLTATSGGHGEAEVASPGATSRTTPGTKNPAVPAPGGDNKENPPSPFPLSGTGEEEEESSPNKTRATPLLNVVASPDQSMASEGRRLWSSRVLGAPRVTAGVYNTEEGDKGVCSWVFLSDDAAMAARQPLVPVPEASSEVYAPVSSKEKTSVNWNLKSSAVRARSCDVNWPTLKKMFGEGVTAAEPVHGLWSVNRSRSMDVRPAQESPKGLTIAAPTGLWRTRTCAISSLS